MTDIIHSGGQDQAVVVLQQSLAQLNHALAEGSPAKTGALLDLISRLAASSTASRLPSDAAAQLCASCTLALSDPSPEVRGWAAKTLWCHL